MRTDTDEFPVRSPRCPMFGLVKSTMVAANSIVDKINLVARATGGNIWGVWPGQYESHVFEFYIDDDLDRYELLERLSKYWQSKITPPAKGGRQCL